MFSFYIEEKIHKNVLWNNLDVVKLVRNEYRFYIIKYNNCNIFQKMIYFDPTF